MRRCLLVLLVCTALGLGACGGGREPAAAERDGTEERFESAGVFIERLIAQGSDKQWGRMWETLHPSQQAFVDRDDFIRCRRQHEAAEATAAVESVIEVSEEEHELPGTDERVDSTTVTYELTARIGKRSQTARHTSHLYEVRGRWRWSLPAAQAEAFKAGECPAPN